MTAKLYSSVVFSPSEQFIALSSLTEIELSGGQIDGVHSEGETLYFKVDETMKKLLASRKPDFVF